MAKKTKKRLLREPRHLPTDKTEFTSTQEYMKAREKIANSFRKIPGVRVWAFDPDITIDFMGETTAIPQRFARRLATLIDIAMTAPDVMEKLDLPVEIRMSMNKNTGPVLKELSQMKTLDLIGLYARIHQHKRDLRKREQLCSAWGLSDEELDYLLQGAITQQINGSSKQKR